MLAAIKYSFKYSFISLLVNKVRSFLTILGIIIGVSAVIIIMSIGAGAQELILQQVKTLGTDIISILPGGRQDDNSPPASVMGIVVTTLTLDDLKAVLKPANVSDLKYAYGSLRSIAPVSWSAENYDANINGISSDYLAVEGGELASGRFISQSEIDGLAKVVVLGSTVKDELFGDNEAVGRKIKIDKSSFEVIGVMKNRGTVGFQDYDDQVFLPVTTMQTFVAGARHLSMIRGKIGDNLNLNQTISEIESTLREQHDIYDNSGKLDDFAVGSAAEALQALTTITDAFSYFLIAMAALSLLVGGVGIMNIMLVSVRERTREIGLRKALGATYGKIVRQFLFESFILTFLGGLIGLIIGIFIAWLVSRLIIYLGYDWNFIITLNSIIMSLLTASLIGIIFGLYPAIKASRLEPVEALRYE